MQGSDTPVADIARVIQLAIAPVFLLTAIGTIINALAGRLARAVDRRRMLEDLLIAYEGEKRDEMMRELDLLARRVRLVLWSIGLAVFSALLVCILIGTAFVGAFIALDLTKTVAILFVGAVAALTACFMLFLREVFLAAITVYTPVHPHRVARK
jgi:hypothetical protein